MIKLVRIIPAIAWMSIIFYFSSRPTGGIITTNALIHFYIFKGFHLIEYAILSMLLFYAAREFRSPLVFGYFYSVIDEIHQSFVPGRTSMMRDTFIDLVGLTIGMIAVLLVRKLLDRRFRK